MERVPRRKGLPDLIAEYIRVPLLLPARNGLIHGLGKQKLRVGSHGVALVGAHQGATQRFNRVLAVVKAVPHGLRNRPAAADMVDDQARGGRGGTSSPYQKKTGGLAAAGLVWDKVSQRFSLC